MNDTLTQKLLDQVPDFYNQTLAWGLYSSEWGIAICIGLLALFIIIAAFIQDGLVSIILFIFSGIVFLFLSINIFNIYEIKHYPKAYFLEEMKSHE